jgi:hypothetical protein
MKNKAERYKSEYQKPDYMKQLQILKLWWGLEYVVYHFDVTYLYVKPWDTSRNTTCSETFEVNVLKSKFMNFWFWK